MALLKKHSELQEKHIALQEERIALLKELIIFKKRHLELMNTYNENIDKINEMSIKASKNDGFENLEELYEYVKRLEDCLSDIQGIFDKTRDDFIDPQNNEEDSYEEEPIDLMEMLDFDTYDESSDKALERISDDDDIAHYVQNSDTNDESPTKEVEKNNLAKNNLENIVSNREKQKAKNSTEEDATSYFNLTNEDL